MLNLNDSYLFFLVIISKTNKRICFLFFAAKDKELTRNSLLTSSNVILTKTTQPMPSIIRKPAQSNHAKTNDPTNDAVAAINKNKALTVTARNINSPAAKVPPVSNSITVSPILNLANKSSGVTITPQSVSQVKANTPTQGRTISPNASSPIPSTMSKGAANPTATKSPAMAAKPAILGSRNVNTVKKVVTIPPSTRILNNNQPVTLQSTPRFNPIIAKTKEQVKVLSHTMSPRLNKAVNNSNQQASRMQSLPQGLTVVRQKVVGNRPNPNVAIINANKRPATEPAFIDLVSKKARSSSNFVASVSVI